jgi:hypothetical protein
MDLLGGLTLSAPSPTPAVAEQKRRGRPRKTKAGGTRPLYFDIETTPDYSRIDTFGLPPLPSSEVTYLSGCPVVADVLDAKTGKTVTEIAGIIKVLNPTVLWIDALEAAEIATGKPRKGLLELIDQTRKQRQAVAEAADERSKLLGTTPEFNRIVSLAMAHGDDDVEALVVGVANRGLQPETEKSLLEAFWFAAKTAGPVVGFNVAYFDLPTIFIRSALLGVEPSRKFDTAPWKGDVIDLMLSRFPKGKPSEDKSGRPGKLKTLARVMGIEIPEADVDGSKVADLFRTDPQAVGRYNASDVVITRELHRLYSGYFCD